MFQRPRSPHVSSLVAEKIICGCAQLRLAKTEVKETRVSLSNCHNGEGANNYILGLEVLPEQVSLAGAGQATLRNARQGEKRLTAPEQNVKPFSTPEKLRSRTSLYNWLITKAIGN